MEKPGNLSTRIRTLYKNNLWQGRTLLVLAIIILLLAFVRVILPPTVVYGATTWLKNQGIDATIEDVSFRIIGGEFSLINAIGNNEAGEAFHVNEVRVHWSWRPLSRKTIVINRVDLNDLKADVQLYSDAIVVAGIQIPLGEDATQQPVEEAEDTGPIEWAAELNKITFNNIETCYEQYSTKHNDSNHQKQLDYCVALADLSWSGRVGYAVDKSLLGKDPVPVSSQGYFLLSRFSVTDRIQSRSMLFIDETRLDDVLIKGLNNININSININKFSALQRDDTKHKDIVRLNTLSISDVTLKDLSDLTIADINIEHPGLYLVKGKDLWEYEAWLPAGDEANMATQTSADAAETAKQAESTAFKLNLGNIKITASDFCLNQTDVKQYYCLNLSSLIWNGNMSADTSDTDKVSAKGSLSFDTFVIHNRTLERDLAKLNALQISVIDAKDINNALIKNVTLTKFAALQRSTKSDDHTIVVDSVSVDSTTYKGGNNLHIASVDIKELGTHASINKDGSFEHDKWLPEAASEEADKVEETKTKEEKANSFNIRLDKFNLDTKRPLLFTDSKYTPPLEAGLKSLNFSINQLDSTKPDQESPFELKTKTTRHGTADIKGVVMPFKEKLSFDATGTVNGLDLRAFSNAAKKEIGHIIKSGQLDADLKLLSVDGQLDSSLGLKLHHFNLKAVSKEDAKALDDMFGMPINQSLILLKDKSDTISLNIPITGDVNNPTFNPMDAIIKATAKATTVTLVTFYTPYGLAYAGGNLLFNMATALNFEPVPFDTGKAEMTSAGKEQLDKLATLLKEKPHLHLTMCGMTNLSDIHELYPALKKLKEGEELKLEPKQREKLEAIAHERQDNAKHYLVNEHKINHSQLILCAPELHEDAESISGIEITI